ncbi:YhfH family protein [Rossellomorea vietnamensis]|uniref:YhfH family protein n=1 Tax=Rossellomorea vietnamensis TaxID=218284 RepID=A0A5D4MIB2_9BACI|nr:MULTISPECIES: protein YhfH [Bacillaceae]TYS01308.1 YhfH family protein [Rossellomorea vietnamensis]
MNRVNVSKKGSKECCDCGKAIDDTQFAYFNQCEKCLRNTDH